MRKTTRDPVIISKMPRRNFRCRDWNSTGCASIGMVTFGPPAPTGVIMISAVIAGATSQTLTTGIISNAYRVLLTRARQGMVVFVPPGNTNDPTRSPEFYDSTFNYLRDLGISEIA